MKMVSAAKYAKAEKDLKSARPYGNAITGRYSFFFDNKTWLFSLVSLNKAE